MKRVRVLREVQSDLADAMEWYAAEGGSELANRFLQIFEYGLLRIEERPESFRPAYREFRRVLLQPFPYGLFFRIAGEEVIVVLLRHSARDPKRLKHALGTRLD